MHYRWRSFTGTKMDINYLLYREQIELMCADRATCEEARVAHEALATGFRNELNRYRRVLLTEAGYRPIAVPPAL